MLKLQPSAQRQQEGLSKTKIINQDAATGESALVPELREYPTVSPHHALSSGASPSSHSPALRQNVQPSSPATTFKIAAGIVAVAVTSSLAYASGAPGTSAAVELLKGRTAADANWTAIGLTIAACIALPFIVKAAHKLSNNFNR